MNKRFWIITFGCQMNKSDSERIAAILKEAGFKSAKNEDQADLIVINACSVRQKAMDRIYGQLRKWRQIRQNKPFRLILTGCVLASDQKKLAKDFDLITSIDNFAGHFVKTEAQDYFDIKPLYQSAYQAYVPIMTGCNNFCAYCVVPYTRGRERSRPSWEIIEEIKLLLNRGYKEITLLGQNVNSYHGQDKTGHVINFPKLLKLINDLPGDFWLRFVTSHPKDMSDSLIEAIAKLDKVCHYVHLPIQSGDNRILKKMNRGYTVSHYLSLIKKIKKKLPQAVLSTDIIVGFPGETKSQFKNTAQVMKKVGYDMAYIARYSVRPGTAAAKLEDNVSPEEKKKREEFLNETLKKTALANNKKLIGRTIKVLVIREGLGLTEGLKNVKIKVAKSLVGRFAKAKITWAERWGLEGKIIK